MPVQFMRLLRSRKVGFEASGAKCFFATTTARSLTRAITTILFAVGSLMLPASAEAGTVWTGFLASDFVGTSDDTGSNGSTPDIELQLDDSALSKLSKRERDLLVVLGLISVMSDLQALIMEAGMDEAEAESRLATELIINSGLIIQLTFLDGISGSDSVPEPGSAVMLGLGLIGLAARRKRRVRGSSAPGR